VRTSQSLFWTILVLQLVLVLFAVFFTQMATNHFLVDYCKGKFYCTQVEKDEVKHSMLYLYFGDVPTSAYTLFMSLTGGQDWHATSEILFDVYTVCGLVFILFIAVAQLAVLNVITGVVCSAAAESVQNDQDMAVQQHLMRKETYIKKLQRIFDEIDANHTGSITLQEFEGVMRGRRGNDMVAIFESLDITIESAWHLFRLLDTSGDHLIQLDDFIEGCLRLQGTAKTVDLHMLRYESRWTMNRLTELIRFLEHGDFERRIVHLLTSLRGSQSSPGISANARGAGSARS